MSSQEVSVTGNGRAQPATLNAEARVTSNFALQHLTAAVLFTEKCAEIERDNEGKEFGAFFEDIRSYASGAIMSSVAGLEAYINEEYLPHDSPIRKAIPNFEEEFYKQYGIERKPTLCKYQLALKLLGMQKLNKGSTEYKDAKNLIALRDTLMHFKPFWDKEHQKAGLQEELKGKFEMSPFLNDIFDSDSEFAANNCMSSSCCKWALKTSYNFIDAFSSQPGFRERWKELLDKELLDKLNKRKDENIKYVVDNEYVNRLTKHPNKLTEYLDKLAIDT
ncbi:MAG: hypothetical protein KME05_00415 [Gloeocapsa sp. UFS-A4-WI-NPMV-4B04]|jgi:hypothetical protein|nr:hypothetical protein [Gloeocapsa sp. UFS-A4-WI-NPMV-4B04]